MLLTTTPTVSGLLPDDFAALLVQPAMQASVAAQVSSIVHTRLDALPVPGRGRRPDRFLGC